MLHVTPPQMLQDKDAQRLLLLDLLCQLGSDSDGSANPLQTFLPRVEYAQALGRSFIAICGSRGDGKTAIFRFLGALGNSPEELQQLYPHAGFAGRVQWLDGYSAQGTEHPSTVALDAFGEDTDAPTLRMFWLAHLCGCIAKSMDNRQLRQRIEPLWALWSTQRSDPQSLASLAKTHVSDLVGFLDDTERTLEKQGQTLLVGYDHLDRIGLYQPTVRKKFAGALLALWLSFSDRYRFLGTKIFISEDLFKASQSTFTDGTKLDPHGFRLTWDAETLYSLLIRHLSSLGPQMQHWLDRIFAPDSPLNDPDDRQTTTIGLVWTEHSVLGRLPPRPFSLHLQARLIDGLAGRIVGRGVTKAATYKWIPNRLKDAHGRIVPRSLLNLVRYAAAHAKKRSPSPTQPPLQLLSEADLLAALQQTSQERVKELLQEYPVVERLRSLKGRPLLLRYSEAEIALAQPSNPADGYGSDGRKVIETLKQLGVLQERKPTAQDPTEVRLDMPDLYRYAFEITRPGAPKRE